MPFILGALTLLHHLAIFNHLDSKASKIKTLIVNMTEQLEPETASKSEMETLSAEVRKELPRKNLPRKKPASLLLLKMLLL